MRVGINTLWLKHKKVGGIESYLFNLLDGIFEKDKGNKYFLLVAKENENLFLQYLENENVELIVLKVESKKVIKRLILENYKIDSIAKQYNIEVMFNPVYSKPIITFSNIPYVTTIHDLQALHYPEYFPLIKRLWLRFAWKRSINTSAKIIAISNFVREDIINRFNVRDDKVMTIYNPIKIGEFMDDFNLVKNKYNIEDNNYYYTVSSMYKHKNLVTLLKVIKKINEEYPNVKRKLVISGISGNANNEFNKVIKELKIEESIIKTGFIDDSERNILYKHCSIFLFPSVFEGFGMPPIEAMLLGKKVITSDKTCIREVTKGLATYVVDAYNEDEWINKIILCNEVGYKKYRFSDYEIENVAAQYIEVFEKIYESR